MHDEENENHFIQIENAVATVTVLSYYCIPAPILMHRFRLRRCRCCGCCLCCHAMQRHPNNHASRKLVPVSRHGWKMARNKGRCAFFMD